MLVDRDVQRLIAKSINGLIGFRLIDRLHVSIIDYWLAENITI